MKIIGSFSTAEEVERFGDRALVGGAVADEGHRDPVCPEVLVGQRSAHCDGRRTADDRVGAEHALGEVGDVHRAALAFADAVGLAVDLEQHRADIHALGDAVAVAAVRRADVVGITQVHAGTDRDRLHAAIEVHETGHRTHCTSRRILSSNSRMARMRR